MKGSAQSPGGERILRPKWVFVFGGFMRVTETPDMRDVIKEYWTISAPGYSEIIKDELVQQKES
jgi:hypothetical protein